MLDTDTLWLYKRGAGPCDATNGYAQNSPEDALEVYANFGFRNMGFRLIIVGLGALCLCLDMLARACTLDSEELM